MALRLIHVGFGCWGSTGRGSSVTRFSSLEAALADADADAVLITAGAAAHAPLALSAVAAGKHVLVEKPSPRRSPRCGP